MFGAAALAGLASLILAATVLSHGGDPRKAVNIDGGRARAAAEAAAGESIKAATVSKPIKGDTQTTYLVSNARVDV